MVKGSKSIKKQIDKEVMISDITNCMALVRIYDNEIHKDYKMNFRDKKKVELDFNELKLSANSDIIFFKKSKYHMDFVNKFLKLVKVFYENNKINLDNLQYYEYDVPNHPCLIIYNELGCIIAPIVTD